MGESRVYLEGIKSWVKIIPALSCMAAGLHHAVCHHCGGCQTSKLFQQEPLTAGQAGGKRRNSLQCSTLWP